MSARESREKLTSAVKLGHVTVRTFNSGGKGGQHGNRTFNGVELTHASTGIKATATAKSQAANKVTAWRLLLSRIQHQRKQEAARERGSTAGFSPEDRVRTYHALRDSVEDTTGVRASYSEIVGRGSEPAAIEKLIGARALAMAEERAKEQRSANAPRI